MKRVKKENKEKILNLIEKAGSDEYEKSWDNSGLPILKKKEKVKKGGTSKARGARFELKVREDLENKGYIVDKWTNNVNLEEDKIIPVKRRFIPIRQGRETNPFIRGVAAIGTGFPDFIIIKHIHDEVYSVIGVEVKTNGTISKIEKQKCAFYLKNKIFSSIWIAKQGEKRGTIEYDDFKEKFGKKFL